MDFGFYKRARGIKHKTAAAAATHFYAGRKPAQPAAPAAQQAGGKATKQPTAMKVRSVPAATLPSAGVAMEAVVGSGMAPGGGDADVDRRAALYISRVQERFRRERMSEDRRNEAPLMIGR